MIDLLHPLARRASQATNIILQTLLETHLTDPRFLIPDLPDTPRNLRAWWIQLVDQPFTIPLPKRTHIETRLSLPIHPTDSPREQTHLWNHIANRPTSWTHFINRPSSQRDPPHKWTPPCKWNHLVIYFTHASRSTSKKRPTSQNRPTSNIEKYNW